MYIYIDICLHVAYGPRWMVQLVLPALGGPDLATSGVSGTSANSAEPAVSLGLLLLFYNHRDKRTCFCRPKASNYRSNDERLSSEHEVSIRRLLSGGGS